MLKVLKHIVESLLVILSSKPDIKDRFKNGTGNIADIVLDIYDTVSNILQNVLLLQLCTKIYNLIYINLGIRCVNIFIRKQKPV